MLADLDIDEQAILSMIAERNEAKAQKDWAKSDEIRDALLARHIELKDGPDGTNWSVKKG